jgi:hypothetical protein
MERNPTWSTDQLHLAATLWTAGHPPRVKRSPSESHRADYEFDATPELTRDVTAYFAGELKVAPAAYELAKTQLLRQTRMLTGGARR